MRPALPSQHQMAAALLDPTLPTPFGLRTWNGSDPAGRFAVYRNNVVHSLITVLGDTFPVLRQLVGSEFFDAMARVFVSEHPPTSPLMHRYGEHLPEWIADFQPAVALPYLADMARLEFARLEALHAADAAAIDPQDLRAALREPLRLADSSLVLHPSVRTVRSVHPVVSLWSAHQLGDAQRDEHLGGIDPHRGESALVFRADDDAVVLALPDVDVRQAIALAGGLPLGRAQTSHPQADLIRSITVLVRHGLITRLHAPQALSHPQPATTS